MTRSLSRSTSNAPFAWTQPGVCTGSASQLLSGTPCRLMLRALPAQGGDAAAIDRRLMGVLANCATGTGRAGRKSVFRRI